MESRTQGSRPRTQNKSKAKDSFSEDRPSPGQGQKFSMPKPRTKEQVFSKKNFFQINFSGDLQNCGVIIPLWMQYRIYGFPDFFWVVFNFIKYFFIMYGLWHLFNSLELFSILFEKTYGIWITIQKMTLMQSCLFFIETTSLLNIV